MSQPKPEIGFNIQMTKVTDRAGGPETITINTAVPPGASSEAIFGKIKAMGDALQKRIAQQADAETRRQERERSNLKLVPALQTPESLPTMPEDGAAEGY